jgi:hypothetical protein
MPTGNETTPPFGKHEAMSPRLNDAWEDNRKADEVVVTEGVEAVATEHWKTIANEQAAEVVRLHGCIDSWRDREEFLMARIAALKNPEDVISGPPPPRSREAKRYLDMISNCEPQVESVESLNGHGLPIMDELRGAVANMAFSDGDDEEYGRGNEAVNSPSHYLTEGGVECIDAMVSAFGTEAVESFAKIAAFKYLWRAGRKDNELEDLEKAAWFARYAGGDDPRDQ